MDQPLRTASSISGETIFCSGVRKRIKNRSTTTAFLPKFLPSHGWIDFPFRILIVSLAKPCPTSTETFAIRTFALMSTLSFAHCLHLGAGSKTILLVKLDPQLGCDAPPPAHLSALLSTDAYPYNSHTGIVIIRKSPFKPNAPEPANQQDRKLLFIYIISRCVCHPLGARGSGRHFVTFHFILPHRSTRSVCGSFC